MEWSDSLGVKSRRRIIQVDATITASTSAWVGFVVKSASIMSISDLNNQLVIRGLTQEGEIFRPGDWAERLCGAMSLFGPEQKLKYSPLVRPVNVDGVRSIIIEEELASLEPRIFKFLMTFAEDNNLQVIRAQTTAPSQEQPNPEDFAGASLTRRLKEELHNG